MNFTKGGQGKARGLRWAARCRAFVIWQKLGYLPWSKKKSKSRKKDFYKGAFDTIPFLNDDAKRTFVHLLLRPGYMIRDYIRGQHERYLAPLTALIIFYAFFAFISSIVRPEYSSYQQGEKTDARAILDSVKVDSSRHADSVFHINERDVLANASKLYDVIYLLDLDRHPERVDTPAKASLAALEDTLRSQGIYLFLGRFLCCSGVRCALRCGKRRI